MEPEIDNAFVKAGVLKADAKAAVESLNKEIDKRYTMHAAQLFTKGDGADLKSEMMKAIAESQRWTITSIFVAVGLFAAVSKLFH